MAEKPHDRWSVPLCEDCHLDSPRSQHRLGERKFWLGIWIDPFETAEQLWKEFGQS